MCALSPWLRARAAVTCSANPTPSGTMPVPHADDSEFTIDTPLPSPSTTWKETVSVPASGWPATTSAVALAASISARRLAR